MIILSVKNLRWVRADHSAFDANVETDELGIIPYTATPDSPTDYGKEIWSKGNSGEYGPIGEYSPSIISPNDRPLSPEQFYGLLGTLDKLDLFMAEIDNVSPTSKKLTCRNQFNNSTTFAWDMVLMTLVAPLVWGTAWRELIGDNWINSSQA